MLRVSERAEIYIRTQRVTAVSTKLKVKTEKGWVMFFSLLFSLSFCCFFNFHYLRKLKRENSFNLNIKVITI